MEKLAEDGTADGEIGFQSNHAPLIGALGIAKVRVIFEDGGEQAVAVHGGFVEVPGQQIQSNPSTIEFYRGNGLLMQHPIIDGRLLAERVDIVMSFTGQSLDADSACFPSGL